MRFNMRNKDRKFCLIPHLVRDEQGKGVWAWLKFVGVRHGKYGAVEYYLLPRTLPQTPGYNPRPKERDCVPVTTPPPPPETKVVRVEVRRS